MFHVECEKIEGLSILKTSFSLNLLIIRRLGRSQLNPMYKVQIDMQHILSHLSP